MSCYKTVAETVTYVMLFDNYLLGVVFFAFD
jgi:hypothetical protein